MLIGFILFGVFRGPMKYAVNLQYIFNGNENDNMWLLTGSEYFLEPVTLMYNTIKK